MTSIVIPDGVTSIESGTFGGCSSLNSIEMADGVTSIGEYAFGKCSNLISIDMPDGLTSIGGSAFRSCSSLTSFLMPAGVTSIGKAAFEDCSSLISITCQSVNPPSVGSFAFSYTGIATIYVPATSVDAYRIANGWKDFANQIQAIPE